MRRNSGETAPSISVDELIAYATEAKLHKLVAKCKRDAAFAKQAVTIINSVIAEAYAKKMTREAAEAKRDAAAAGGAAAGGGGGGGAAPTTGPLTDRQAWSMLADLVDTALSDVTLEERAALKAAFREEAAKAA